MEQKKAPSTIVMGLVIALIFIVIDIIAHLANFILADWFKWIPGVLLCIALIIVVINYGKQMNDNVTFGNLFAYGFKVSATAACFLFLYTILSVYVLFPGIIDQIMDKALEEARKQNKATEEQIQQGMAIARKFMGLGLLVGSILGTLIAGCIGSLLGAAVAKKNPNAGLENQFK